jgi:catechol 2,3-dioxygenase-like lactoylglutathione lyase family enzyme
MAGLFDDAAMVSTVLRVRDVDASVAWYREKLGLEPIYVGADGPEHPVAVYSNAGSVVSLWQLPAGQQRRLDDNDRNTYVVIVMNGELESARESLLAAGVDIGEVRRSENHEFVWFHDLDGNRFELSQPMTETSERAFGDIEVRP